MSDTQHRALSELISTLVHALRVALGFLDENDPLRRQLVDTLLTAQMRDPARVQRLVDWLREDPTPDEINPPGVPLTNQERLDRLQLVPKLRVPMRDDQPRAEATGHGDADLAAAARTAAGLGGQIGGGRTNMRPFLAAANVVRNAAPAGTIVTPPACLHPALPALLVEQHGRVADFLQPCPACATLVCTHPWHVMVADGVQPFDDDCPGGCHATVKPTVQTSTIATPVDGAEPTALCKAGALHGPHPHNGELCIDCPECQQSAAAGDTHKGDYGVTGHPDLVEKVADGVIAAYADTVPRVPGTGREITAIPPGIRAETDGDTTDWTGNHAIECMARDCTGCA